ncbi:MULTISPECIES: hypothetical protein [Mycobacterium]|uniref:hypothetical protein n=1 Tax=Mycobacterium TaxID=1763 RepID=UPI0010581EB4|nr:MULTISPECIES: hypothetical protein [Mycobacterium]MDM4142864.1 hypothetical protein [Mycobacterium sp. FLAC0960]
MSAHQDVGAAELSRGNPAASNSNNIDPKTRPEGGAAGLRLHWPTRARGMRRWRMGRGSIRSGPEPDYGINLLR